jgi:VWFA-related protein
MRRFVIALLSLLAISATAQQLPPKISEKVDVNLVLLDAIVTDSRGHQMLGLDKNDFVVTENGAAQSIDSVDYFTNRQLLNERESKAAFKVDRVRDDRYFIVFLDKPSDNALFDRLTHARNAVVDFVEHRMKPGDQMAVVGHDVRLKVWSDFTADKRRLKRALDDAASFTLGITAKQRSAAPDEASIIRNLDMSRMMNHTGTVYEAMETLADSLRTIHARKELLLFSAGILEPGEEVRGGVIINESRFFRPMMQALNAANVSVYPMNLLTQGPEFRHQTLARMANQTGGEYYQFSNNFEGPLKRIENTTNGYYLIAYYTKRAPGEHGFQKVQVSLKNPEFRVTSREGYAYGQ